MSLSATTSFPCALLAVLFQCIIVTFGDYCDLGIIVTFGEDIFRSVAAATTASQVMLLLLLLDRKSVV